MYQAWLDYLVHQDAGAVQKRSRVPAPVIKRIREKIENREPVKLSRKTSKALRNSYRRTMYKYVRDYGMSRRNAKRWAGFSPSKVFHQVKIQNEFIQVRAYRQKRQGIESTPDKVRKQMESWNINPIDIEKWNESPKLKRIARRLKVLVPEQVVPVPEIRGDYKKRKRRRK